MNKKIFFILLINCFVSYVYAAQEVQNSQVLEIKSRQGKPEKNKTENKKKKPLDDEAKAKAYLNDLQQEENLLKKKPSYLSPTKSSESASLSKESTKKEWENSLRTDKKPTVEKNNKKKEEKADKQKPSVSLFSKKNPVKPVDKNNTEVTSGVWKPNINGPLENDDIKKTNSKEEILKKIMQLDQDIVAIENQIIKFEHDDIKEKMNISKQELEELKKPMKNFKDAKIEEKKKLETEFRNLEEKIPEKNFGKELMSQLGKKIQEDALRDKKYENEISNLLKKEQEKKEKEQKAQKEQASKKGLLGSIKSFFKQ